MCIRDSLFSGLPIISRIADDYGQTGNENSHSDEGAVSYTHLDVYKRQADNLETLHSTFGISLPSMEAEPAMKNMNEPQPVSYTHLDVYKRQNWKSRRRHAS